MKLSKELNEILNKQVLIELKNANIYTQIASYFEDLQLSNLAKYFENQNLEEKLHSQKFLNHINSRLGGKVELGSVEAPNFIFNSIEDVGNAYEATEIETTKQIESIMELVEQQKSYIDRPFILEMLGYQIPEEDEANKFKLSCYDIGSNKAMLRLWDSTFNVN